VLLVREELRRSKTPGEHALSIGVFDGVHEGHRMLVRRLLAEAKARNLGSGIITFHPHPITVVRPDIPFSYLDSLERRVELLRELGIDFVSVLQFTSELQQVSAYDFVRLLVEEAGLRLLVVGDDFHLGRGREGDSERIRAFGDELGFELIALPLLQSDADRVSSTRVRNALGAGEMEAVATLLGRPFSLRGPVLHGDERGRTLNFPTLNVGVAADRALPPNGVYVTRAHVADAHYHAVTNIGTQPTFDGTTRRVETHLLDFEGDLYGQIVVVDLLHRIREERKFAGIEELVAQIKRDVQTTREWFA
jgi:riboflavin kinase/FMN adenylyltransferase